MVKLYKNESWLRERYLIDKWSQNDIAVHCDVSLATIQNWLSKFGIKSRTVSESNSGDRNGSWVDSPYKDYHKLYDLYINQKKSIKQIATESGLSKRTIARWLDFHNIETRSPVDGISLVTVSGEDHPSWKGRTICPLCGGKKQSSSNNCQSCHFDMVRNDMSLNSNYKGLANISKILRECNKDWRLAVFNRDNYTCKECGDATGGNLHAHHLVPFYIIRDQLIMEYGGIVNYDFSTDENRISFINTVKTDYRLHDIDNGVTLCENCHSAEHRRLRWYRDAMVYVYNATVLGNYDGDTVDLDIDLGFGLRKTETIRLFGIDTYEINSKDMIEYGKSINAKNLIESLCVPGRQIVIRTYKPEKYGRYLATILLDHKSVNDFLVDINLAKEYYL